MSSLDLLQAGAQDPQGQSWESWAPYGALYLMSAREHEIEITVIVNGHPVELKHLSVKTILREVAKHALDKSGNSGQPLENWELRDANGQVLDLNRRIEDYGIVNGAKLFLSLKAGVGG